MTNDTRNDSTLILDVLRNVDREEQRRVARLHRYAAEETYDEDLANYHRETLEQLAPRSEWFVIYAGPGRAFDPWSLQPLDDDTPGTETSGLVVCIRYGKTACALYGVGEDGSVVIHMD